MSFLRPEAGLLFWMLLSFGIVFFILYRYGFPVITNMIDKRKMFIDAALNNAKETNRRIKGIEEEGRAILKRANEEQLEIVREAVRTKEEIIREARKTAEDETSRMISEARETIRQEKEEALRELRGAVAELSVAIAEKVLRDELSEKAASEEYIGKLLDEAMAVNDDKR